MFAKIKGMQKTHSLNSWLNPAIYEVIPSFIL